jgi:hypothetical protein
LSLNIESTSLTTCYQALRINTEFICITRTESKKIIEKVRNGKHVLTVALVKSVLQVLDHMGPTGARSHRRQPRHHGRRGRRHQQQQPRVTLDLDQLRRTGGDLGAGSSCQPPADTPNPTVRVLERPPSPSPDPSAYRSMEPSDPVTSPWGRREPPCTGNP